jgi:hypothetical protein
MNERIRELLNEATSGLEPDLSLQRTVTLNEMQNFAELIVRECADVAGRDVGHFVLKHFGVEDTVQDSNLHTCPYAEEIHNDYETLCDCDEEQTYQCAMDI